MKTVSFGAKLNKPIVVCLGFFGCIHRGHAKLLSVAKNIALQTNSQLALFTFSDDVLVGANSHNYALFTFDERQLIYQQNGVDVLLVANYSDDFANTNALQFAQILQTYDVTAIVCGSDYTFGCDRKGVDCLKGYFSNKCNVVALLDDNGQKISTQQICSLVASNQIAKANELLAGNYFICGTIEHGRHVGRTIGFPTANVSVARCKVLPSGVFCGKTQIDNRIYNCVINVGAKPTYRIDTNTVEVHVIGYNGDLYGKKIAVEFTNFLRETTKFDSEIQLIEQLKLDVERATND